MSLRTRICCLCTLAVGALCIAPGAASAEFTIAPGAVALEVVDKAGTGDNRAGIHPDRFLESFEIVNTGPSEYLKELVVDLPAGLSGDVGAVPFCSPAVVHNFFLGEACTSESQVGVLRAGESDPVGLFSIKPGPNEAAVFGAMLPVPILFSAQLRPADQGMSLHLSDMSAPFSDLAKMKIELWGIPADHQVGTSIPRRALLTTPSRCGSPLSATVRLRTWEHPDRWISQSGDTGQPLVGCEGLPFNPKVDFSFEKSQADVASGVSVDLQVPQNQDPDGRASAQVKDLSTEMPEGMTISPAGAGGLAVCSDEQLALGTATDAACPAASRVGEVELVASALSDDPIKGAIYLGQEHPNDRFRLFVVANIRGTQVKTLGSMHADPKTGRLTTSLGNLPQAPIDSMHLRFAGGPHALLATPLACGPAKTVSTLTPSNGAPPLSLPTTVAISGAGGSACSGPPPFAPTITGGSTSTAAGRFTSFKTILARKDGEQLPDRMEVAFPPGMSAAVGSVGSCAEAAAASGKCPAASRIGRAVVELGPGVDPIGLGGDVYLTGPYRRAPFGIALVFRAQVGPFDLGTLVVRGAMRLDSHSGRLTVAMDSLPRVFEGLSVRFETFALEIDRPSFLRNPTSCAPSSLTANVSSATGQKSQSETPFRVQGCVGLPFRPSFAIALSGRSQLHEGGKPGLGISIGVPSAGANLHSADIALPGSLKFDSSELKEICARREAMNGNCAKGSRVGSASIRTPLFNKPLKGSIYVAQPRGGGQPDLWTHLEGEGLSFDLRSSATKEKGGQLHATLADLPDIPLSKLTLQFDGGEQGVFSLDRGLCRRGGKPRQLGAEADSEGQNGAQVLKRVPVVARPKCAARPR